MPAPVAVAHQPTEESIEAAAVLSAAGWKQDDIARLFGITPKTLRKYYREALDQGALEQHAKLTSKAFAMALAGDKALLIFMLKTKFGWREKDRDEVAPQETEEQRAVRMFQRLRGMEATVVGPPHPPVDPA